MGAILAGGLGRRMGGAKAARVLGGRPLVAWPAAALREVCSRVAVVAKPGSDVPALAGVERWDEPVEASHPAVGILHSLATAGEEMLVCAADMPFVTVDALRLLLAEARPPACVAVADARLQPLLGVYWPSAADALAAALPDGRLSDAVESLAPARVELPPPVVRSVDTLEALAAAERELRR